MTTHSRRFWLLFCGLFLALGTAFMVVMRPAHADDPHRTPPVVPKPIVIVEHERDNNAIGALLGAGVTFWIMHYRATHHHAAAAAVPLDKQCTDRVERVQTCVIK